MDASSSLGLSAAQLAFWHENGYLVLEDFASHAQTSAMVQRAQELVEGFEPKKDGVSVFTTQEQTRTSDDYFLTSGDKVRFFFEENAWTPDGQLRQSKEESINKIGHALHEQDPVFREFIHTPRFRAMIQSLGFADPLLLQGMLIFKQRRIGGPVNPHQDSTFLYTDPPSCVGLWTALHDATLENGCLWAVPGSHKLPLQQRFIRNPNGAGTIFQVQPGGSSGPLSTDGGVAVPMKAGSMILIHGQLVHWSHANTSDQPRNAFSLHVIEGASTHQYPADNWLQRFDGKSHTRYVD
jgi:phytanoyl-CoA hydroxylase